MRCWGSSSATPRTRSKDRVFAEPSRSGLHGVQLVISNSHLGLGRDRQGLYLGLPGNAAGCISCALTGPQGYVTAKLYSRSFDATEILLEVLHDAPVAGRFGLPFPCLGVIAKHLKVGQLMSQRRSELGGRGEVVALLADVRVRAQTGSLLSSSGRPGRHRLRETLGRGIIEPAPRGIRRVHAQDPHCVLATTVSCATSFAKHQLRASGSSKPRWARGCSHWLDGIS